ncbi:hypothetical protein ACU686_05550 [Yinghuangia aomiensis]
MADAPGKLPRQLQQWLKLVAADCRTCGRFRGTSRGASANRRRRKRHRATSPRSPATCNPLPNTSKGMPGDFPAARRTRAGGAGMAVTQKKRPAAAHLRVNGVAPGTSGPPGVTLVGSCKLPGLAGTSKLYESYDAYLRPYALLGFAASNQYTVVLESVSDEHRGVGPEQFDAWLEMWDQSIGALSAKVELAAAAVTLDAVVIDGGEAVEAIPRWAAETGAFDWLFAGREPEESDGSRCACAPGSP